MPAPAYGGAYQAVPAKPGAVTAIGVMLTVGGGWAIVWGILMLSICIGVYDIIAGIFALIAGIQVLTGGRGSLGLVRTSAILLIIGIISIDFVGMTLGIIVLVLASDERNKYHLM